MKMKTYIVTKDGTEIYRGPDEDHVGRLIQDMQQAEPGSVLKVDIEGQHGGPRPGAGRPLEGEAKRKNRSFKVTDDEWARIGELAQAAGLNISEYIRKQTLGRCGH